MIKVQIHKPFEDRNEPTFRMMIATGSFRKINFDDDHLIILFFMNAAIGIRINI